MASYRLPHLVQFGLAAVALLTGPLAAQSSSTSAAGARRPPTPLPDNTEWSPSPTGTSALSPVAVTTLESAAALVGAIHPAVVYSFQYGDGVPSAPAREEKTQIHRLSPSIRALLAERLQVSYSPSLVWYSNDVFSDRVDHAASAKIGGEIGPVEARFGVRYTRAADSIYETSIQTLQTAWGANLGMMIPLSQRTSADVSLGHLQRRARQFNDVQSWDGFVWIRHNRADGLSLAAGAGATYNAVDPGADLFSRQILGNVGWSLGDRLRLKVEAGVDWTRFEIAGTPTTANPVFGASLTYRASELTLVSLGTRRSVATSYFSNRFVERERFNLSVTQRVLGRFNLSVAGSAGTADYVTYRSNLIPFNRNDRLRSAYASIGTSLGRRTAAALSYSYTRHKSNLLDFANKTEIAGVTVTWSL